MTRYSYEEALASEELRLDGNHLLVQTISNNYSSVQAGILSFKVVDTSEGYEVRTTIDTNTESKGEPIIKVNGNELTYKIHKANVYERPEWITQNIEGLKKENEILRAFKAVIESRFTFGGPAPYVSFSTDIYAESTEAMPIGQAEIGKDFIIN